MRKGRKLRISVAILSILAILIVICIEVSSGAYIEPEKEVTEPLNKATGNLMADAKILCSEKHPNDTTKIDQCVVQQEASFMEIYEDFLEPVWSMSESTPVEAIGKLMLQTLLLRCHDKNTRPDGLTDFTEVAQCLSEGMIKIDKGITEKLKKKGKAI